MDDSAQISIEMLLIAGALFAISLLVVTSLSSTSKSATGKMIDKVNETLRRIENIS